MTASASTARTRFGVVTLRLAIAAGLLLAACRPRLRGHTWSGRRARVGARFPNADGFALAMAVAVAPTLPWGIAAAGPALLDPPPSRSRAAVALLSSALPHTLELFALRRLPTPFAVLMSLGPAVATLAGYLVLGQAITPAQGLAVALVVVAGAGAVGVGRGASCVRRHSH